MNAPPLEIEITAIGAGGDGIGDHDGTPVYVPQSLPGETIRAHITSQTSDQIHAQVDEVLRAAPERTQPPCPLFVTCGSCALQHMSAEAYQNWKMTSVKTTLARAGFENIEWLAPRFFPAASRRRVSFATLKTKRGFFFGYNQARSKQILNIERCLILDPALNDLMRTIRPLVDELLEAGQSLDVMVQKVGRNFDMVLTGAVKLSGKLSYAQHEALAAMVRAGVTRICWRAKPMHRPEILLEAGPVLKSFGAMTIALPPGAFLQASDAGEQALCDLVLDFAGEQRGAVADLFCGAGTFSGHLIGKAKTIYAADSEAASIAALQAAAHSHSSVHVEKRDLFREPLSAQELEKFDVVIFDPPRAGAKDQAERLAGSKVQKIIAVSCNPATFARDAKILADGGYRLSRAVLVDQFVYSAHSEIVAEFGLV